MLNPPITGIQDLDAYLAQLALDLDNPGSTTTTTVIPDAGAGEPVGYSLQYLHIKYATDSVGTGFSNSPAGMTYFGTYSSSTGTESTNPTDYTWFNTVGFGGSNYLYYTPIGGRQIKFAVAASAPSYKWLIDPGTAIDIDNIVPTSTVNTNEIVAQAVTANANSGQVTSVVYPTPGSNNTGNVYTTTFTSSVSPGSRLIIHVNLVLNFVSTTPTVAVYSLEGSIIQNSTDLIFPLVKVVTPCALTTGSHRTTVTASLVADTTAVTSSDTFKLRYSCFLRDTGGTVLNFTSGDNIEVNSTIVVQELKR